MEGDCTVSIYCFGMGLFCNVSGGIIEKPPIGTEFRAFATVKVSEMFEEGKDGFR